MTPNPITPAGTPGAPPEKSAKKKPKQPPIKNPGVGKGNTPEAAEIRARLVQTKIEHSDRKKRRFLKMLKEEVALSMDSETKPYPDFLKMLKVLKIPYETYNYWKNDQKFEDTLEEIENIYLDDCIRIIHNAKGKNPYLALDILRARRRSKWGQSLIQNASFTQINFISDIKRPPRLSPTQNTKQIENADFQEIGEDLDQEELPEKAAAVKGALESPPLTLNDLPDTP